MDSLVNRPNTIHAQQTRMQVSTAVSGGGLSKAGCDDPSQLDQDLTLTLMYALWYLPQADPRPVFQKVPRARLYMGKLSLAFSESLTLSFRLVGHPTWGSSACCTLHMQLGQRSDFGAPADVCDRSIVLLIGRLVLVSLCCRNRWNLARHDVDDEGQSKQALHTH